MKYSVIGPNGERFGPVDVQTLNQWVVEGRVLPQTMLEGEDGSQMPASAVPGVMFVTAQAPGQPTGQVGQPQTPYTNHPRQPTYAPGEIPPDLQGGWNWGAFLLSWIWGLNHKAYLTLITLGLGIVGVGLGFAMRPTMTPGAAPASPQVSPLVIVLDLVQLGLAIWFGLMGNRWAWQSGRFSTVEECKRVQKIWGWWGLGVVVVGCCCGIAAVGASTMAVMNAMQKH